MDYTEPAYPGLVIEEDMAFQRRQWTLERIGWSVMALIVLSALLGLLGGQGPLSRTTSATEDARFVIDYPQYARRRTPETLHVSILAQDSAVASLWFSAELLEELELTVITPRPSACESSDDGALFHFPAQRGVPVSIYLTASPRWAGMVRGRAGPNATTTVPFEMFVYP